jgi:hypothetical protein
MFRNLQSAILNLQFRGPMLTMLCLVTGLFASGQGATEWLVVVRLSRGQELVYSGSCAEEAVSRGSKFTRHYQLESRVFVLDTPSDGAEVALFTALKYEGEQKETHQPRSARLELARIDLQGRMLASARTFSHAREEGRDGGLVIPLEGPPTLETGFFLEFPNGRVGPETSWEVMEEGRPPRTWKVVGTEPINGVRCLKITGLVQSADWDHPRADQAAWRRQDTVWVSPAAGFASRLERVIERRDPTLHEPSQRLVVNYHLENSLVYPRQFFDMRKREIELFNNYSRFAEPYLRNPGQQGQALDSLVRKISNHCENEPATPYREALLQLQRRLASAQKGEALPVRREADAAAPSADPGRSAPDFVTRDLVSGQTVRLQRLLGRPLLLVFYQPSSRHSEPVLRFAQSVHDAAGSGPRVLGLCMVEDAPAALRQASDLGLSFPILTGTGLRAIYEVNATPKFVVIDPSGMIRGTFEGWGEEIAELVREGLRRWQTKIGSNAENP